MLYQFTKHSALIIFIFIILLHLNGANAGNLVSVDNDSTKITIDFNYSPEPYWISLTNNTFVKTKGDGFEPKDATSSSRYLRYGTAYLSWHPKGLYEVLIYTDNLTEYDARGILDLDAIDAITPGSKKQSTIDSYSGLHVLFGGWNGNIYKCVPLKLWCPKIATNNFSVDYHFNEAQTTAPVRADGSIEPVFWNSGTLKKEELSLIVSNINDLWTRLLSAGYINFYGKFQPVFLSITGPSGMTGIPAVYRTQRIYDFLMGIGKYREACYHFIPEKNAIAYPPNTAFGSYKKVIASTIDGTYPRNNYELTFAIDLSKTDDQGTNTTLQVNALLGKYKYNTRVFVDLVGN